nr:DUF3244 domain-containing protein [Bacteroidales bacterium]
MTTALYVMGNDSDETFVEIDKTKNPTSNIERSLVQDIEAYHTNNMVYFTFNENLGLANIVISNANTGAQVETTVPTNCGNVQVDISSLGQGNFTILIYAGDTIYTGLFTL